MLIGVIGAWLMAQVRKTEHLNTVAAAIDELTNAAEMTVLQLQQTTVEGLKSASEDGKLSEDEIWELKSKLVSETFNKMSDPSINVLKAANVDLTSIIEGAAEGLIARIKLNIEGNEGANDNE